MHILTHSWNTILYALYALMSITFSWTCVKKTRQIKPTGIFIKWCILNHSQIPQFSKSSVADVISNLETLCRSMIDIYEYKSWRRKNVSWCSLETLCRPHQGRLQSPETFVFWIILMVKGSRTKTVFFTHRNKEPKNRKK